MANSLNQPNPYQPVSASERAKALEMAQKIPGLGTKIVDLEIDLNFPGDEADIRKALNKILSMKQNTKSTTDGAIGLIFVRERMAAVRINEELGGVLQILLFNDEPPLNNSWLVVESALRRVGTTDMSFRPISEIESIDDKKGWFDPAINFATLQSMKGDMYECISEPFRVVHIMESSRGWETGLMRILERLEQERGREKTYILGITLNGIFCLVRRSEIEIGCNLQFLVDPQGSDVLSRGSWKTSEFALVEINTRNEIKEVTSGKENK